MFSIKLFKKCCTKEWQYIFETHKQQKLVKAKEMIFNEGDPVEGIYFIESGKIKVLSKAFNGENRIIRLAADGMILGHRGLHSKFYPISAEALTDSVITFVPIKVFLNILKANPELAIYLINFMSDELKESEIRMKSLLIQDPRIRIAMILVKLIDCFGYLPEPETKLSFTLSRTDIANMAGTTYETTIRTIALFKKKKLIRLEGKEIHIINEIELRSLSGSVFKE